MAAKRKKHWSTTIEQAGQEIRIYERAGSSRLWYSVIVDGKKMRKSLRTSDRALAQERARSIALSLARVQLTGGPPADLRLAHLAELYLHHRGPMLSDRRRRFQTVTLRLFREHLGDEFQVTDFSQHHADTFVAARRSGSLKPEGSPVDSPADGTIENELQSLGAVCNWATRFRRRGRPLLRFNPVRGLKVPHEDNPARPLATEARYRQLLSVADDVDPMGRLRCLIVLAWETGRRISAMLQLRRSDILLTADQVRATLAAEGQDESQADHWPQAIRWRSEADKQGYLSFSPITIAAREAIEIYLREHPVVGEGWLFARDENTPQERMTRRVAGYRLKRAEKLAGLPHSRQGGWHAFRRAWATRRKHLPVQDVMAAGGWRDIGALQRAYQAADPVTVRRVMDLV